MATFNSLNSLDCPNCGAPLEFAGEQKKVRCKFCGSYIERSDEVPTSSEMANALEARTVDGRVMVERFSTARHFTVKMRGDRPVVIAVGDHRPATLPTPPTTTTTTPSGAGGRAACLVILFILLVTLVPIGFALLNTAQLGRVLKSVATGDLGGALTAVPTLNKRIRIGESGVLVPSLSDAPPDIIVLTTQYPMDGGENEHRLAVLGSAEPKLLWQSQALGKDTYRLPILANNDYVYIVQKDILTALYRSSGSVAWEAKLPDEVSLNLCVGCVRLLDDRLFTLSDDGTLLATDARTGQPVWSYRAVQDSPRGLYVLGGRLAFMDRDENNKGLLRLFSPTSGEMLTIQPTCPSGSSYIEYADWTTPIYPSLDGSSFYMVFGSPQVCAQRWDAQSLTQLWLSEMPRVYYHDDPVLVTEQVFYLSGDNQIIALDAATGEMRTLLANEEYSFVPLTVAEGSLLVRAVRERGTKRFEIWSVDIDSGQVAWTFDLGQKPPFDPPDAHTSIIDEDEPVWTWHVRSGELTLLSFKRAEDDVSHAIVLEGLNLQTGASSGPREIRLGIETIILSAPEFMLWRQDTLWMSIEGQLLGFDAAAGKIVYRWP